MRYPKLMFFFLFTILIFTAGTEAQERKFYEQNSSIVFIEEVTIGNAVSDNVLANITIKDPDNMILVGFQPMTYNSTGKFFNFTLDGALTWKSGRYERCVFAVDSLGLGQNGSLCTFFFVNPTGIEPTDQRTGAINRAVYFMFGIALLLFISFFFAKSKPPIKWTLFLLGTIFALISINLVFVSLQDAVVNPRLETFFSTFTVLSFYLYWFAFGLLIIIWIFTAMNTWILKKNLQNIRRFGSE